MLRTTAIVGLALLAPAALGQTQPPDMTLETVPVAPGLWMLVGNGGNIGVSAGPDGVFLVDDQYAPMTPAVTEAVARLHPEHPRFVLNTHWHGDHSGGNENLAKQGTLVVAHDGVRRRMASDQFLRLIERPVPASPPGALPVVTFSEELSLHLNGDEIRGIHVAGAHTDGDTIVHFRRANVIHAGDVFFRYYPFIDISSGGTIDGMLAAIDRILALADERTKIMPGHGALATRADLAAYREMLAVTSARIRALVREGRSLEEIQALAPNADYDPAWAWAFITAERYVKMLFQLAEAELSPDRSGSPAPAAAR